MDFSKALIKLKEGKPLFRQGWDGTEVGIEMWVYLIMNSEIDAGLEGIITPSPYFLFYHDGNETDNFWIPSMEDVMAEDWVVRE